jgi:hypothetical protein
MAKPLSQMLLMFLLLCGIGLGQERSAETRRPEGNATIVASVALKDQTATRDMTVLFTPKTAGLYRATAYMYSKTAAPQNAYYIFSLFWHDLVPTKLGSITLIPNLSVGSASVQQDAYTFSPQPGTKVTFYIKATDPPPVDASYTLFFTIEQLQ